jgi:hypothetical protein
MTIRLDRLALFAAVLVLLAGYLAIFRPAEAAIADRYAQLDDGRVALDRRLGAARRAAERHDEARALAAWIRRAGLRDARSAIVDRFLRELAATAQAEGVAVRGVGTEVMRTLPAANAAAVVFDELPLTVSLDGSYAQVLRVVRDLDRGPVAARVGVDALTGAGRDPRAPALRATLHVTLLRVPDAPGGRDVTD